MHRKLMVACMGIVALAAFGVAPAALASPVLTHEGKGVPAATKFIATNTGEAVFTGTGGVEVGCTHVKLTGEITKNTGTEIAGSFSTRDFNGTGTSTECTSNLFNAPVAVTVGPLCFTVKAVPAHTIVTTGCGKIIEFTLHFTGVAVCRYARSALNATFTTTSPSVTGESQEEVLGVPENSFVCPAGFFLDMTLDLWTDSGGVESGIPLVIS